MQLCPICRRPFLDLISNRSPKRPDREYSVEKNDLFQDLFAATISLDQGFGRTSDSPSWIVQVRTSDCALLLTVNDDLDDDFPTTVSVNVDSLLRSNSLPGLIFKGDVETVADACLLRQAARSTLSVFQLSHAIAQLVVHFQNRVCHHGVLLNQRVLTTLVQEVVLIDGCFALYNVIDLFKAVDFQRLENLGIIDEELFEVPIEEYAIPAPEFLQLKKWETYNCRSGIQSREKRKWGHLLYLSHRWKARGVPGDENDLVVLQQAVRNYIDGAIERGGTSTVKNFSSEGDFGIWLDYMMVPNDPDHADCDACRSLRHVCVAKMAALPTISTTIALHPHERQRGWILHELTMNSHQNIVDTDGRPIGMDCRHGTRINIMVNDRVHFTNGSDGTALRCSEFLRLGQLPRTWPSVTKALLSEWASNGVTDERGDGQAKEILLKYARTFHLQSQGLKRAMVVWPQLLARRGIQTDDFDDWVYVSSKEQRGMTQAMMIPFLDRNRIEADSFDFSPTAAFDLEVIVREIEQQRADMEALGISPGLASTTSTLQLKQFILVTMGLRAELSSGEGWLHWVSLSVLTEALASCKRSIRLYEGVCVMQPASCSVSFSPIKRPIASTRLFRDISRLARESISSGVQKEHLDLALDCLTEPLDPDNLPESNLSGYAATWFDQDDSH